MKIAHYLVIALFILLAVFFMGLPDLRRCPLPRDKCCDKHIGRTDVLIMAVLSLAYSGVAFTGLGSMNSPESFAPMWEQIVEFSLDDEREAAEINYFTGVGEGSYYVVASPDGVDWTEIAKIEQNYVSIFKWHNLKIEEPIPAQYLRIYASGSVYLGEFALNDSEGHQIPLSPIPGSDGETLAALITDEQHLVPAHSTFINSSYFDEIYHARTAWEHINAVRPYEVSHPPLGKLIIALGMLIFGTNPFGWRFMGTFFGVLMLPIMYVFSKKIFGGKAVPTACTIVLGADFMHFVQTRLATIDTYGVFFTLLMYLFMYLFISQESEDKTHSLWWLALSGISFGLGVASKWTAVYAGAGLAVIWLVYWVVNRRKGFGAFLKNSAFCLVFFVLIPAAIYYVSYFAYGVAAGLKGPGMLFTKEYARIVLDNQEFMFSYHSGLVAEHPYSSRWYQWLADIKPILYYLEYFEDGTRSSFGAFVNPALCWGGLASLFILLFTALFRRDKDAAFIFAAYLAQLLPWVFVKRLTFAYHYFPCSVFLVLALGYVFKLMRLGKRHWKIYVGGFAFVSVALFVLFYPTLSGYLVDNAKATSVLGWLPTWPF